MDVDGPSEQFGCSPGKSPSSPLRRQKPCLFTDGRAIALYRRQHQSLSPAVRHPGIDNDQPAVIVNGYGVADLPNECQWLAFGPRTDIIQAFRARAPHSAETSALGTERRWHKTNPQRSRSSEKPPLPRRHYRPKTRGVAPDRKCRTTVSNQMYRLLNLKLSLSSVTTAKSEDRDFAPATAFLLQSLIAPSPNGMSAIDSRPCLLASQQRA